MKYALMMLFALASNSAVYAQDVIRGRVIDVTSSESEKGLQGVIVQLCDEHGDIVPGAKGAVTGATGDYEIDRTPCRNLRCQLRFEKKTHANDPTWLIMVSKSTQEPVYMAAKDAEGPSLANAAKFILSLTSDADRLAAIQATKGLNDEQQGAIIESAVGLAMTQTQRKRLESIRTVLVNKGGSQDLEYQRP